MDPLSVAGSVAGIIALGLQLSSTLQEYIETAGGAPERLRQIVIELQATAHGIKDLNDFLDWDRAHEPRIISQYGEKDFHHVIEQCDAIFRKVTVCVAKAWRSALDAVDEFHPLEPQILSIELSSIERLALPWNLREIGQYILDLDRLRQFLHFRLTVALLGENLRRPSHRNSLGSLHDDNAQAQNLKDELFYQYQRIETPTAQEIEINRERPRKVHPERIEQAMDLMENWPYFSNGKIPSCQDIQNLPIELSGLGICPTTGAVVDLPVCLRELQDISLSQAKDHGVSIWKTYANLRKYERNLISSIASAPDSSAHLVYLKVQRQIFRRASERISNLFSIRSPRNRGVCTIYIIVAYGPLTRPIRYHTPTQRGKLPTSRDAMSSPFPIVGVRTRRQRASSISDSEFWPRKSPSPRSPHCQSPIDQGHVAPRGKANSLPLRRPNPLSRTKYSMPVEEDKNAIVRRFLTRWTTIATPALNRLAPPPYSMYGSGLPPHDGPSLSRRQISHFPSSHLPPPGPDPILHRPHFDFGPPPYPTHDSGSGTEKGVTDTPASGSNRRG